MILGIEYMTSGETSLQVRQGFEQFLGTVIYTEYSLLLNYGDTRAFFFSESFKLYLLYINFNQYCNIWFRNIN